MCTSPEYSYPLCMRLGTDQHLKQNRYKHMSVHPSDLNVSGENSVARGSCSGRNREESEPAALEDVIIITSETEHIWQYNIKMGKISCPCA
jgi:hypothetical protein